MRDIGGASSTSIPLPHFSIVHAGASRSVSPLTTRMARRLCAARKLGAESWYLSGNRTAGRVRWVCRAQWAGDGGGRGDGRVRRRIGWRP